MHVTGDLGFSNLVLVISLVLPLIGLIFRRKWRRAVVRSEEIKRLLILAAEEAARAEYEASYGYGAVKVQQRYHQCAVCFSPTTTRCARCKAVRYCSGKCQIVHWRQGHKDECHPPSISCKINDVGNSSSHEVAEQDQSEVYGDRFKFEGGLSEKPIEMSVDEPTLSNTSSAPEVPRRKDNEVEVEFHADGDGASTTNESSDASFSGFSASHTGSESSDDVSVCESISSNESEKLGAPPGISIDMLEAASSVKSLDQIRPSSPKFARLVDSIDSFTKLNKVDQMKPGCSGEGQCASTSSSGLRVDCTNEGSNAERDALSSGFWGRTLEPGMDASGDSAVSHSSGESDSKLSDSRAPLTCSFNLTSSPSLSAKVSVVKGIVADDALPAALGSSRHADGVASVENANADTPEVKNSPSFNCHTVNGTKCHPDSLKSREIKSSIFFSSYVHPPSNVGRESISADASDINSRPSLRSGKLNHVVNSKGGMSDFIRSHSVPGVRSEGFDDVQASSDVFCQRENGSSNGMDGFKTSLQKAVEQLRGSNISKQNSLGVVCETGGRYSDKGLFSYELFVKLYNWNRLGLQPCGLVNCGNSCYANSVLQCLVFTPPLTAFFLQGLHSKTCAKKEWCFTCELEKLILKAKEGKSPLSPVGIVSQLQSIGSQLGNGREEDAHEFLRYAIETMQSVCIKDAGLNASGPLEDTTLIGLTFGGYLRSKIKCMKCRGKSERHERMMDLTVEIEGDIGSLEEALRRFTGSEILDGENKYQCGRCKSYEKAKKKLTIAEAPNVLTIALKRFKSGKFGKLNKPIQFPEILDLAPYMSGTSDKSPIYRLYGVVVHLDVMNAAFSGHYVCYVKSTQNKWFKIDDSTVIAVEREKVLNERAYMLLYARCSPRAPRLIRNSIISHDVRNKVTQSWVNGKSTMSKLRSPLTQMSVVQFHPGSDPPDGPASLETFYSKFHRLQRILEEDSSSDSSSLISSNSDEGSCSTESTRDSSSADDISDFIFGDSGCGWKSPCGSSSNSDTTLSSSSSLLYSRHSPSANLVHYASCPRTGRIQTDFAELGW